MKRCKYCKWSDYTRFGDIIFRDCDIHGVQRDPNTCYQYARKCWLWFAWWIPKVFLLSVILFGGCSQTILTMPDGGELRRNRFLDWEQIGSVSYDDGSFTMDGYQSDTSRLIGIIDRLLAEKEEVERKLATLGGG